MPFNIKSRLNFFTKNLKLSSCLKVEINSLSALVLIFIVTLSTTTCLNSKFSRDSILLYILLSFLFAFSYIMSLNHLMKAKSFIFHFFMNNFFLLGFFFKFSIHKISNGNYREPIGSFDVSNSNSEVAILIVIVVAMIGVILSQAFSALLLDFKIKDIAKSYSPKNIPSDLRLISLLLFSILLVVINLNSNIILFGIEPSIKLPLGGNAIFYLALTRGIIFIYFYYFLRQFSILNALFGSIIISICSIGVLSRMVVLTYFSVLAVNLIINYKQDGMKKFAIKSSILFLIFLIFSYVTVLLSGNLRSIMYANANANANASTSTSTSTSTKPEPSSDPINKMFSLKNNSDLVFVKSEINTYVDLALGRWIGIEGVMAVESYKDKGFALLRDALLEKSYDGNSFYTKISNPNSITNNSTRVRSTSVPGPVAFFYYSNSLFFVFAALFFCLTFFSLIEFFIMKHFINYQMAAIFFSSSMAFDFFQFGISPIAFVKYLSFSLGCIAIFYFLINYTFKRIRV